MTDTQRDLAERYLPLAESLAARRPCPRLRLRRAAVGRRARARRGGPDVRPESRRQFCDVRAPSDSRGLRNALRTDRGSRVRVDRGHPLHRADPNNRTRAIDDQDAIDGILRRLPALQAAICRLLYVEGMEQKEVARRAGMSAANMSRLHGAAIRGLRRPAPFGVVGLD